MTTEEINKKIAELEKERAEASKKEEPKTTHADKRDREPNRVEEK